MSLLEDFMSFAGFVAVRTIDIRAVIPLLAFFPLAFYFIFSSVFVSDVAKNLFRRCLYPMMWFMQMSGLCRRVRMPLNPYIWILSASKQATGKVAEEGV